MFTSWNKWQQWMWLNDCCMYLHVTMLAEITDHTGTWLLQQVLSANATSLPTGLDSISTSLESWPIVHWPSNASWNLWTKMVCQLFTGPLQASDYLDNLGHGQQHTKCTGSGNGTSHTASDTNTQSAILLRTLWCQLMFSLTIPMNQLYEGPPVTPSNAYNCCIRLPVPSLLLPSAHSSLALHHTSLVAQFHMTLAQWQCPLFGPIRKLQPMNWII